jgi:hypothetical protein
MEAENNSGRLEKIEIITFLEKPDNLHCLYR